MLILVLVILAVMGFGYFRLKRSGQKSHELAQTLREERIQRNANREAVFQMTQKLGAIALDNQRGWFKLRDSINIYKAEEVQAIDLQCNQTRGLDLLDHWEDRPDEIDQLILSVEVSGLNAGTYQMHLIDHPVQADDLELAKVHENLLAFLAWIEDAKRKSTNFK